MSPAGDAELLVRARCVLLDALAALDAQRDALVLVGAQAIYLHTASVEFTVDETTKDSDLAIDTRAPVDSEAGGGDDEGGLSPRRDPTR